MLRVFVLCLILSGCAMAATSDEVAAMKAQEDGNTAAINIMTNYLGALQEIGALPHPDELEALRDKGK